jgi:multidrug efflux system membrane fusion protein
MSLESSTTRRMMAGALVASTVLGGGLLFDLGESTAQTENPVAQAPRATPASVAITESRPVVTWKEFSGRLEAVEDVEIRSRIPGVIQALHFREGAIVARGDLIATIDPAPYAAEVAHAEGEAAAAQARLAFARGEQERGATLLDSRTVAQSDYDRRLNAGLEAEADLQSALARLQTARLNLSYTEIRAPIAGRIGRVEVTAGNLIDAGAGSPVLTRIVSVDPIYASFEADEATVARALASLPAGPDARGFADRIPIKMSVADEESARGRLQFIGAVVDPISGTVRLRAAFPNPDGALMPGQFARLSLGDAEPSPAVLVSERAVGTDQDKRFVLVLGAGNTAEYREVSLGAAAEGLRVVTAGLSANERVVVNGLQHIRPGALVEPEIVAMRGGAPALQASAALD